MKVFEEIVDNIRSIGLKKATNKRLQQENIQLNADVARLASIVQTLNDEIARLRAVGTGKVVELVRQ